MNSHFSIHIPLFVSTIDFKNIFVTLRLFL
uniref:Uncharacterized protein n=1 Tax=Anguilla anguilla TaxID=7936 RepID=A0A0E9QJV3_ANGAN